MARRLLKMYTIEYKGWYIHGYTNKDACKVIDLANDIQLHAVSLRAAKCLITRILNNSR